MVKKSKEMAIKAAEKIAAAEAAAKAAEAPAPAAGAAVAAGGAKPSPAKSAKTDVLAGADITDDADVVFK